jgi:hypothetical protein
MIRNDWLFLQTMNDYFRERAYRYWLRQTRPTKNVTDEINDLDPGWNITEVRTRGNATRGPTGNLAHSKLQTTQKNQQQQQSPHLKNYWH